MRAIPLLNNKKEPGFRPKNNIGKRGIQALCEILFTQVVSVHRH